MGPTYEILKICRKWDSHVPKAKRFLRSAHSFFSFFMRATLTTACRA